MEKVSKKKKSLELVIRNWQISNLFLLIVNNKYKHYTEQFLFKAM